MATDKVQMIPTWKMWIYRVVFWGLVIAAIWYAPKVVGGIVAGVMLVVVILWTFIKYKIRQWLKPFNEIRNLFPSEIHLKAHDTLDWHNPVSMDQLDSDLRVLGFQTVHCFTADETPGINMRGYFHLEQSVYACVYDQQNTTPWIDYVIAFEGGRWLTVSNTQMPAFLERSPTMPIKRYKDQDAAALFESLLANCPNVPRLPVTADGFVTAVEDYFAQDAAWREEHADDQIHLQTALEESFLKVTQWSAVQWNRDKERVCIVHNRLSDYEVSSLFEQGLFIKDEKHYEAQQKLAEEKTEQMEPIEAFQWLVNQMDGEKFEKLAVLDEPIKAVVFLAPLKPAGWDD
jgi:hypothetical protein